MNVIDIIPQLGNLKDMIFISKLYERTPMDIVVFLRNFKFANEFWMKRPETSFIVNRYII